MDKFKKNAGLIIILSTTFGSILGLAWKTGSATEGVRRDVQSLQIEQASHVAYEKAHNVLGNRLTRIETMMEMSLRASGIKPPPKGE